ncbi:hypothetical protein QTO34_014602 [Cnephaeus nilssonii]|uniref:HSac2 domain-containing protein n=1 Tax=Cnephaeus nilssonii TaxID=3371016 RepID=A0AA40I6N7_CNENI|nr:hypothetical protein QTO34_014602 [Eptesicus nilssonii]
MGRQRNSPHMKEKQASPEKEVNEMEARNLSEKEFREMVIRWLKRMEDKFDNMSKNQEEMKKNQEEMKNDIAAVKNSIESINSRLEEAEDRIRAQCTNSCALKGTVGREAAVGTGVGLSPSFMPPLGPSHHGLWSTVCLQPCSHRSCSHALMVQSDWGQHQQQVRAAAPALAVSVSGAIPGSGCERWLPALIAPQEQGEVKKPSEVIQTGSRPSQLLDRDQRQVLAVGCQLDILSAAAEAEEAPATITALASCEPGFWLSSTSSGGPLVPEQTHSSLLSIAGELGACPLVHQAFQKPPEWRRLLKGLVHQWTGTQLPRFHFPSRGAGCLSAPAPGLSEASAAPKEQRLLKGLVPERTGTQLPAFDGPRQDMGSLPERPLLCHGTAMAQMLSSRPSAFCRPNWPPQPPRPPRVPPLHASWPIVGIAKKDGSTHSHKMAAPSTLSPAGAAGTLGMARSAPKREPQKEMEKEQLEWWANSRVQEMSTIGSFEGFQPVSLKQEGDDQPSETDRLSMEEGDPGKDPVPKQISKQPSVTESTLYPNPYHGANVSRKYFVTRPGTIETAMEDLKGHIAKTSGEKIQGFWLLTEIDHWNNEKERILVITDKTLLICKYDFIMLSCVQLQRIPLSAVYRICLGKFAFPGMSLDNQPAIEACRMNMGVAHSEVNPNPGMMNSLGLWLVMSSW